MKKILFTTTFLTMLFFNNSNAFALYSCSVGPCGDGTSCFAMGSASATCICQGSFYDRTHDVFYGVTTATCSSNSTINPNGGAPNLDPAQYGWDRIENVSAFIIRKE